MERTFENFLTYIIRGKWVVMMMNRQGEWVVTDRYNDEKSAYKGYKNQPRGYAYKLYNPEGQLMDSKGDATYIVMG